MDEDSVAIINNNNKAIQTDETIDTANVHLQLENLVQKIKEVGKCPVCLTLVKPPSTLCGNGHVMCKLCVSQLHQCPLCCTSISERMNITFNTFRAVGLDSILNELPRICDNDMNGCTFIDTTERMERIHKLSCVKRLVGCRVEECKWRNLFENIHSHIKNNHNNSILTSGSTLALAFGEDSYTVLPVYFKGLLLWKHIKIHKPSESMFIALDSYTGNSNATEHICVYTIKGINNNFRFTWTSKIWGENEITEETILDKEYSMSVPYTMLDHIADEDDIKYTFKIKELIEKP